MRGSDSPEPHFGTISFLTLIGFKSSRTRSNLIVGKGMEDLRGEVVGGGIPELEEKRK